MSTRPDFDFAAIEAARRVLIRPLDEDEPPMFARSFSRVSDAVEYIEYWTALGSCWIEVK